MMMVKFILVKPSVLQSTSWGHPFSEDDFEFEGWIMLLISLLQVSERHLVVYQWYNHYWELRDRQEKCRSVCLLDRAAWSPYRWEHRCKDEVGDWESILSFANRWATDQVVKERYEDIVGGRLDANGPDRRLLGYKLWTVMVLFKKKIRRILR